MKKKMFGKVLAFAALLTTTLALTAGAAGKVTFDISSAEAQPGQDVDLTITVTQNDGFASALFTLSHGDALTFVKTVDAGNYGVTVHNAKLPKLYWNNPTVTENYTNKDLAATVTFTVSEDAEIGSTIPVTIEEGAQIYDWEMNDLECVVNAGSVKVIDAPALPDSVKITFENKKLTYTGKAQKVEATVKGAPKGTTVTYSDDYGVEKADSYAVTAAGEYNVTATISAPGYKAKEVTAVVTVAQKELNVSGLTAANKVYNGNTDATLSGGKLDGVISGDVVEAEFPTFGTFASKNVGTGIAVTFEDITLSGVDSENYTVKKPSVKANITVADIKVKADDKSMAKGGEVPALTYMIESEIFEEPDAILSGDLTTKADGTKVGTFDILQGTLKASSNYKLSFTKGTLTVEEKKAQTITVSTITDKTYGDEGFKVSVVPDAVSGLTEFTFTSSDPTVASIDAEGVVTIHKAGTTVITVKQAGDDTYAAFEKKQTLKVAKVKLVLTPTRGVFVKKYTEDDPEFTFTYDESKLVGEDTLTGKLSRKNPTESKVGKKYALTLGTVIVSDNYTLELVDAYLEVVDKTPQTVTLSGVPASVTYGDADFTLTATADETSGLDAFTFETSNDKIATVDADGKVKIVGVGKVTVTVKQAGDDAYAAASASVTFTVSAKVLEIDASGIDLKAKSVPFAATATVVGDDDVKVDFDSLETELNEVAGGYAVTLTGFTLIGEDAAKYELKAVEAIIVPIAAEDKDDLLVEINATAENGSVEGNGTYLIGATVTLTAVPDSKYRASGWVDADGKTVSKTAKCTFIAGEEVPTPVFKKKTSNGGVVSGGTTNGSSDSKYDAVGNLVVFTVRFESNFGSFVNDRHVNKNYTLNRPDDPVRVGYVFGGWYTDALLNNAYDFNTPVTENFTLYAKWTVEGADEWKNPFSDVAEGDWFYDAVKFVNESGLMNGMSDTTFAPNDTLTRAMFVTILYRADGEPEVGGTMSFTDVESGSWYEKAVIWAVNNGIVNGITETEFAPNAEITREQMATILYRYAAYKGYDVSVRGETSYTDKADVSPFAGDAVTWAFSKAVMSGHEGGSFAPQENATRAQAAAVFMRFLQNENL